jgi:hypothetical protein
MVDTEKIRKQEIDWDTACDTCDYVIECEKHNGSRHDALGCRAIAGCHLCKLSWKPFFEDSCKKDNKNGI